MKKKFAVLLLVVAVLTACMHLTPRQRYATALDNVDAIMDAYRAEYTLQTPQEQAIWDRDVAPYLLDLVVSLRDWELSLNDATKEQAYLNIKAKVRKILINAGVMLMEE